MTLILARASAAFVVQVTDRLVSYGSQPFDKVSNKNILYIASNAVVAMAYTGVAYLGDIPTDHFIAERLAGVKIDPANPPMMMAKEANGIDVGLALSILKGELDKMAPRVEYLLISIQGWQWDSKGRLRPVVGDITQTSPRSRFRIYYEPRNWYVQGAAMTVAAPPSNITQAELEGLSVRLRDKSISETESLLVNKIRDISKKRPSAGVGPHCISILIPPPSEPNITIRYLSADPSSVAESQKLSDSEAIWAYSPWTISPKMCAPPGEITGGGALFRTSFFSITYDGPAPTHPMWLMSHSGQKRRKRP